MSNQNSNSAWKNIIEKMKKNEEQLRKKEREKRKLAEQVLYKKFFVKFN